MKRTASIALLLAVVFELGEASVPPSDADRRVAIGPTEAEAPFFQALLAPDADFSPICQVCLHTLHAAIFFDPVQRYADLRNFYLQHDWQPELAWTDRQLAKARPTSPGAPARAAP